MAARLLLLEHFRLPGHPNARLNLHRSPLAIVSDDNFSSETDTSNLTVPIGIATVLYHWCPDALAAFLDLDAWFSFTWILTIQQGEPDESKIEIGRVGNQITFGTLNKDGDNWTLMITYNISMTEPDRGAWVPNPKESMENDRDIVESEEIERLGKSFVRDLILNKRWNTNKKLRHQFFVEYAPMDIFGDGIPMNPHWLYKPLNLSECTTCGTSQDTRALSRCGRCGTATYCSSTCQRKDWAVHKDICNMRMEDRGQALTITQKGGLIGWDTSKTMAEEGSEEPSKNPNFAEQQLKRQVGQTEAKEL